MNNDLPDRFWLGKESGQWPLQAFVTEKQVTEWLVRENITVGRRRAWEFQNGYLMREVRVVVTLPRLETVEE